MTETHPNGATYKGSFKNGLRDGKGVWKIGVHQIPQNWRKGERVDMTNLELFMTKDGKIFLGEMSEGKLKGTFDHGGVDGYTYVGELEKNAQGKMVKQGKGVERWANGESWEGTFKDDVRVGEGVETRWDGAKIYGTWVDGERPKEGKSVWPDGSVYEG